MKRTNSSQSRVETDSKSIFELHFFIYLQIEFQFQFNSISNFQSTDRSIDGFKMKPTRNQVLSFISSFTSKSDFNFNSIQFLIFNQSIDQSMVSKWNQLEINFWAAATNFADFFNTNQKLIQVQIQNSTETYS